MHHFPCAGNETVQDGPPRVPVLTRKCEPYQMDGQRPVLVMANALQSRRHVREVQRTV
jgi:hypothetical protein